MKLSELKPSQNKKICVLGDSGSGKTVFAAGCPGPIYFFDFDGKISSAASYFAKDPERLTQIHYDSYQPADEKDHPFARYDKKLTELAQAKPFPYATVVVDSLTTYADAMFKEIVRQ
ncbi:MAG TPA: AAA family ATPase, partial [Pyrinomonadaceae bacterium]|nr:AAA family ATPase [Pyrinomonadaceae bacterium]